MRGKARRCAASESGKPGQFQVRETNQKRGEGEKACGEMRN